MKVSQLILFFLFTFVILTTGFAAMAQPAAHDVVVVFQKNVTPKRAGKVMQRFGVPFHEGMDSSRGKTYFYHTGPKYIARVTAEKIPPFLKDCAAIKKIHECYLADWNIVKD